jgi:hypothetical protein
MFFGAILQFWKMRYACASGQGIEVESHDITNVRATWRGLKRPPDRTGRDSPVADCVSHGHAPK